MSLSDVGSYASIVGLTLTVYVFFGVRKLKTFYILRARLPELNKRLRDHASNLSNHLNDLKAFKNEALQELAVTDATLRSLKRKLSGQSRRLVSEVLKSLKRLNRSNITEQDLQGFYLQLLNAHEQLKETERDLKWER